jgi:hypothetical protein
MGSGVVNERRPPQAGNSRAPARAVPALRTSRRDDFFMQFTFSFSQWPLAVNWKSDKLAQNMTAKFPGVTTALLLAFVCGGCGGNRAAFECPNACAKVYQQCGSAVKVSGAPLPRQQCELVCEEGLGARTGAASRWLDCVQDSVCPGQTGDQKERDLRRYNTDWCNPQFEVLIEAG